MEGIKEQKSRLVLNYISRKTIDDKYNRLDNRHNYIAVLI